MRSVIKGVGSYLPEKILTNEDLSKIVETSDEWITERTGIKQRHIAEKDLRTSTMGASAARNALADAGIDASEIDIIVMGTSTTDEWFPSCATQVGRELGIKVPSFDLQAACSGFLYACATADNFLKSGTYKTALVIGADQVSKIVDWSDRSTCVLFGDGAGAAILRYEDSGDRGIISHKLYADGSTRELLYAERGEGEFLHMGGREIFKNAVTEMSRASAEVLEMSGFTKDDIDWVIPHQANIRILHAVADKLNVPLEKLISTVHLHGNTSAASIPLAMDVAKKDGRLKEGDLVCSQAFGGGLTWASMVFRF